MDASEGRSMAAIKRLDRMDEFLQQYQHLKIQFQEITSATNNFNDENNCIGRGGFGKVYKGEVSHSEGRSMAAIKRLDRSHGQGKTEFLKEVTMLSRYVHENLVSLLGFCYEGDEMILVYEYASRGSLNHHLNSPHLKWSRRLQICLDAAKGLGYLHDPRGTHQRLIHCDIKSSNILLDEDWSAKLSDFGLSLMGPANELQSVIVTLAAGTGGYIDPQYWMTNTLTKESDVYSFGVVLFEVLCGTLCCTYNRNGRVEKTFVPTWIESYEQDKLNDITFKSPTIQPLDQSSLEIFTDIAYRCLKESREDRPKMAEVVAELENAFERQEFSEWEEIAKSADPPLKYRSKVEFRELLTKGVLLNGGKTWFSLNKKGEHCEMISFAECLVSAPSHFGRWSFSYNSRFDEGTFRLAHHVTCKTHVKARFLSPGITYVVNLVFKNAALSHVRKCELIPLQYKLQGETKTSISYLAYDHDREDGWWVCELYEYTSDHRILDLHIMFDGFHHSYMSFSEIEVEGIEFRPLEKVEQTDEKQPITDSYVNWEEKLPTDYEYIMKWSKSILQWTTKLEAYSIMCKGFLINDGQEWFSLDKNGKKCHVISARAIVEMVRKMDKLSLPESRFGEAIQCDSWKLCINSIIQSQLVSSNTTYAAYIVYKLPKDQSGFEVPMLVVDTLLSSDNNWYINLASPQTPIIRSKAQNTHNTLKRRKMKGLPQQRNDGWMEVQIWEFQTATATKMIHMRLKLATCGDKMLSGLIIHSVEFRPI